MPVDRGNGVGSEKHSACELQESGKLRISDPCNDNDGSFAITGSFFCREFCTAISEDIVCEIRSTYGGGVSATKDGVWGASCVVGATQGGKTRTGFFT